MPSPVPVLRSIARIALGLSYFGWMSMAEAQTALEPADGGTDYAIQGEYTGTIGASGNLGIQVVAQGSGQFLAVFLPGGLPGQGWNDKERTEVTAALKNGEVDFAGSGYIAKVMAAGLVMDGQTPKGETFSAPKVIRQSPTLNAAAPSGATILFDGTGVSAWKDGTATMDARKLFKPDGTSESTGAVSKQAFLDFTLHLEFRVPFMPSARGQSRGNSGIYLQNRDEVQILDSFGAQFENGADTMAAKRECGAFFEYFRPSLNMAYPPLAWQTYDIDFTAAKYDAAGKTQVEPGSATVRWNGVIVQDKRALVYSTLLGDPQGPAAGPLRFQFHGDPVYYRNIWVTVGASGIRKANGMKGKAGPRTGLNGPSHAGWNRLDGRDIAVRPAFGWYLEPAVAGLPALEAQGFRGDEHE